MTSLRPFALALAAVAALAAAPAHADTFYVDGGRGDDGGPGTEAAPWRSLQHAADRVRPGDTVMVRAGTHRGFDLRSSGTQEAPIRFVGEDGAIINLDNSETPDGINIENASWVEIEGFTITNVSRAGIRAAECGAVTIRRNRIDAVGVWGIFTGFCDDLLITDNVVSGAGRQHGIYVSNSGDRPIVRGNTVFDCAQSGIQLNGDVNEGGDGVITGALVEENVIHHVGTSGGAGINFDGVVDSVIRNNLLYGNAANGIAVFRIDGGAASTGNRIVHNTIVMPEKTRWAIRLYDGSTGTTIVNNILLSDHDRRGALDVSRDSVPGLVSDHNVVIGRFTLDDAETILNLDAWRAATGQDQASVVADARDLFVDPGRDQLEPRPGSPAIDRGRADVPGAPRRDLRRFARPVGAAPDVGAHEWCKADQCIAVELEPDPARAGRHTPGNRRDGAAAGPARVTPPGCCGGGSGGPASSAALSAGVLVIALRRRRPRTPLL